MFGVYFIRIKKSTNFVSFLLETLLPTIKVLTSVAEPHHAAPVSIFTLDYTLSQKWISFFKTFSRRIVADRFITKHFEINYNRLLMLQKNRLKYPRFYGTVNKRFQVTDLGFLIS
jgi:hypothetical protein